MHFLEHIKPELTEPVYIKYFYGYEALSYGYNYYLTILTHNSYNTLKTQLGNPFEFVIQTKQYKRYFNGILINITELHSQHYHQFKLKLISTFQLLQFDRCSDIYKNITLELLLTTLFKQHNLGPVTFDSHLKNTHIDFEVQHNESTYSFIKRLLTRYKLLFYYKNNQSGSQMHICDIHHMTTQLKQDFFQSDLMRCNYQFFNWRFESCYSSYPLIELTTPIKDRHYVNKIRHKATNPAFLLNEVQHNEIQGYIQYLNFKTIDKLIKPIAKPSISGIQLGHVYSNHLHIKPSWDYYKKLTKPLQSQSNIPIINFKPKAKQSIIIAFENNDPNTPYIAGAIYNKQYLSPHMYTQNFRTIGIQDCYKNNLMIQLDNKPGLYLHGQKRSSFDIKQYNQFASNIKLKSNNTLTLDAHKSLLFYSDTCIYIGNQKNYIKITPEKITLHGINIHFQT